jgi:hypothetical protein
MEISFTGRFWLKEEWGSSGVPYKHGPVCFEAVIDNQKRLFYISESCIQDFPGNSDNSLQVFKTHQKEIEVATSRFINLNTSFLANEEPILIPSPVFHP